MSERSIDEIKAEIVDQFTKLKVELLAFRKAMRQVQGASNLKDCHRIAERILNTKV